MKIGQIFNASAIALALVQTSQAAITLSSNNSGGTARQITTSAGVLTSATLQIGYFVGTPSAEGGDLAALRTNFTVLGTGGNMGTSLQTNVATAEAGKWAVSSTGRWSGVSITGITGTNTASDGAPVATQLVQGTRLFLLIYTPTEFALVSDLALWKAPKDDPLIPGGASLTLAANFANLDNANSASDVLYGSYATPVAGTNQLRLAPIVVVPEPTTSVMALLAGLGLISRRRR